jgi:cytochrome c
MKNVIYFTLSLSALLSHPAWASAELAQQKNCMSCHNVARKVVGPAFKDVAAKYAGQADAVEKLTQKVRQGGSGVWGAMFMPAMQNANPAVSEAEAKTLVQWILLQK